MIDTANGRKRQGQERGAALILALLLTVVVTGIVVTGTLVLQGQRRQNRTNFQANYQAVMTARSGLIEALGWFRRQTSQPVTAFEPQLDTGATPPVLDTEEPDIGLVRSYPMEGDLWARYEVWKAWAGDPDPSRLDWRSGHQCEDISSARTGSSLGSVWRLRSLGYIYRLVDPSLPFNIRPNEVLASELAETDVMRNVINLPGQAAINVGDGNSCHINTNTRVTGGSSAGVYYPFGTGTPTTGPPSQNRVVGTPALAAGTEPYDDSIEAVFGITLAELSSIADAVVTTASEFPSPLSENSIVVIDMPSFSVDSSNPLQGTGIVVAQGNVVLSPGNNSLFSGLLYVDGNLTIRAPCEINGAIVCTGNLTIQGMPDYATINYDGEALSAILSSFGSYRLSNTTLLPRRVR